MTKSIRTFLVSGLLAAALVPLAGCHERVLENLAVGLRDGTLTTVGGILEDLFNERFDLEESAIDEEEEEGGDDLFVRT